VRAGYSEGNISNDRAKNITFPGRLRAVTEMRSNTDRYEMRKEEWPAGGRQKESRQDCIFQD
jgi:hypothetical protein